MQLLANREHYRESTLAQTMRLSSFQRAVEQFGVPGKALVGLAVLVAIVYVSRKLREPSHRHLAVTLLYSLLYFLASPSAILINKILMKDMGFHYPVMVSALGQATTAICAVFSVHVLKWTKLNHGTQVPCSTFVTLGAASALAMVLGQFPYLYLTVAFIQMLKAFSPAYMVILLSCLGVEYPSTRIKVIVLGLCLSAAVASAGEVNFNLVGILFMVGASISDALRLVLSQWLLKNLKLEAVESLYYTSPICVLWLGAALLFEVPTAYREGKLGLALVHPGMFLGSCLAGFLVNIAGSLLTKRTSAMTLKTMTMARNAALVLFSALCMGETITALEATGYSLLLLFFVSYSVVKANEPKESPRDPVENLICLHVPQMSSITGYISEGDEESNSATPMLNVHSNSRSAF
ncbi:hypothetical protein AB1Y20_010633 [Prymnesium parvum]|uniref:Sugar phosphate transporter domain-containing protein n=1 Tax=Prymnesium parvum TaxID=97485 RepID=A0AB34IRZ5_PRYPA